MPKRPDRAWLQSFCIAWGLIGLGLALWPAEVGHTATPLLASVPLLAVAILRPEIGSRPYQWWYRVARKYARIARAATVAVCYYTVFVAVGAAGRRVVLEPPRPARSGWVPKSTLARSAYRRTDAIPAGPLARNWWTDLLSWSLRGRQPWVVAVVPFVLLLRWFDFIEPTPTSGPASNIYTLY